MGEAPAPRVTMIIIIMLTMMMPTVVLMKIMIMKSLMIMIMTMILMIMMITLLRESAEQHPPRLLLSWRNMLNMLWPSSLLAPSLHVSVAELEARPVAPASTVLRRLYLSLSRV